MASVVVVIVVVVVVVVVAVVVVVVAVKCILSGFIVYTIRPHGVYNQAS